MRKKRAARASVYDVFAPHDIGRELQAMSDWLDEHRQVLGWVARDARRRGLKPTGRSGSSVESVLRCALLKQHRRLSYEELAFHLYDSASFQAFARLPMHWCAKKSALQRVVSAIRAQTWERINGVFMDSAREERFEPGERVRIDSTNLSGVFLCAQTAARYMRDHGGRRIINISSVNGQRAITGRGRSAHRPFTSGNFWPVFTTWRPAAQGRVSPLDFSYNTANLCTAANLHILAKIAHSTLRPARSRRKTINYPQAVKDEHHEGSSHPQTGPP
jgi:hypothetical protein